MSALAEPQPEPGVDLRPLRRLLTVAEYQRLGETDSGYTELQEGHVLVSPSPTPRHTRASKRLTFQLEAQLPGHLEVLQDLDVDLELVEPGRPGFSRRPDVLVVTEAEVARVDIEGGMIRASEVLVVVEIVSPGSKRTDTVIKRGEYADAGVPHYWIVDLDDPVSLVDCHLAGEFGYQDGGDLTGVFETTVPFPVRVELDRLR